MLCVAISPDGELIAAGVTCICLPDTVGCATPSEYGALVRAVRTQVPNIGNLRYLAAHGHNDLGFAYARKGQLSEAIDQPVFNLFYPCGLPFDTLEDYP